MSDGIWRWIWVNDQVTAYANIWTKKAFQTWVFGHKPTQIAGYSMNFECCPFATYLKKLDIAEPWIDGYIVQYTDANGQRRSKACPTWLDDFIEYVDGLRQTEHDKILHEQTTKRITFREVQKYFTLNP